MKPIKNEELVTLYTLYCRYCNANNLCPMDKRTNDLLYGCYHDKAKLMAIEADADSPFLVECGLRDCIEIIHLTFPKMEDEVIISNKLTAMLNILNIEVID